jgi:hypothetical protein
VRAFLRGKRFPDPWLLHRTFVDLRHRVEERIGRRLPPGERYPFEHPRPPRGAAKLIEGVLLLRLTAMCHDELHLAIFGEHDIMLGAFLEDLARLFPRGAR